MSSHVRSSDRAVLLVAIAVLPWVALSRMGEWRLASPPPLGGDGDAIHALTSRAVVTSDGVLFSGGGKRADGTRQVSATPPSSVANFLVPLSGWDACSWDPDVPAEAITLRLACRGPPLLALA
jgi:hypothetical protein